MVPVDDHLHVERHVARLSDLELVDVIENHPGDYEACALEIARAELARRKLAPAQTEQLREEAAATAEPPPSVGDAMGVWFAHHLLLLAEMLFWPVLFVLLAARAGTATTSKRGACASQPGSGPSSGPPSPSCSSGSFTSMGAEPREHR
jgi:hypothetical protein